MVLAKALGLLAAVTGIAGTTILFFWTFGFEMPGMFFLPPDEIARASARNARRVVMQRIGFGFLVLSYLASLIGILCE